MSAVAFESVTLDHGRGTVLSNVSFEVAEGAFVGVLGPNGAGKTTLMRAILGLLKPESGAVTVFGRPASRGNPSIGYLPQSGFSISSAKAQARLTGFEFLLASLGARSWGRPVAGRNERKTVEDALERVDARGLASRALSQLSGGERQRILIAQALLSKPRLLMLDEPLAGLDPSRQRNVVERVHAIARETGMTVFFSAHDVNAVLPAADRILYLGNGDAAIGSVDTVINAETLGRLYDAPVHVARIDGRIFVIAHHGTDTCRGPASNSNG